MTATYYEIRLCQNCGLRYPLIEDHPFGARCPVCLGKTQAVLKYEFKNPSLSFGERAGVRDSSPLFAALLDNIRSAWNVGAIFRTADGLGIDKLYLCGITPTPDSEAVRKTSLGAEEAVVWEYSRDALETVNKLKDESHKFIVLEQDNRAIPLTDYQSLNPDSKIPILIVGNEVTGVDPELLDICDQIIHIPMLGQKRSLNVEVAFGIAAFQLTRG
jgi:23S rRNA (guanosine2251-2'-O)-methyltransferase